MSDNNFDIFAVEGATAAMCYIFDSLKEAGEKLGLYPQNICKVCKGKRKTINGLKFMYI